MTTLMLQRLNPDGTEVVYDGAVATATIGGLRRTAQQKTGDDRRWDYVVELTPGLWKIGAIAYGILSADLCFGAPAFEVGAGDVVYLGTMAMPKAGGYALEERNLDAAREILAPAPALAAKVRAAEYTNGFLSDCFGSYAYAYEVPGAPFIDYTALARAGEAAQEEAGEIAGTAETAEAEAGAIP